MNDTEQPKPSRLLTRVEAALRITEKGYPIKPKTLAKLASIGGGPMFRKAGKHPRYEIEDCDAFAMAKITRKVRSVAELRAA